MKKPVKILLPLIFIFGLAAAGVWWRQHKAENGPADTLTLYGNIEIRDAQLAFQEQERVSRILVEEGDVVGPGQVLARQDSSILEVQIREAQAQVAAQKQRVDRFLAGTRPQEIDRLRAEVRASRENAANLKRTYQRIEHTTRKGASSEQALDDARVRYAVEEARLTARQKALELAVAGPRQEDINAAKEKLQAVKASLELLRVRLQDLVLKAPSRGVVQSRVLEPGEMAGPNRPVLTLALTDDKWVRAYLPEPDLGGIEEGMQARIFNDSFPKKTYRGRVGFISPVAEFTPKSVQTTDLRTKLVYEVRVNVQDPDNELRLGMPVTLRIEPGAGSAEGIR